jgi:hypothetical protein
VGAVAAGQYVTVPSNVAEIERFDVTCEAMAVPMNAT